MERCPSAKDDHLKTIYSQISKTIYLVLLLAGGLNQFAQAQIDIKSLASVTDAESEEALATIYTGLTRLRQGPEGSWMTVICSSPRLGDFGKSFPEFIDRAS